MEHPEHARLAGGFAAHWGNADFAPPEPRADILVAVARHDDAWAMRDADPFLTREGRPSAFSRELVGTYSAFEEIDLADYLAVRGRAADAVAADNPMPRIVISMHTVALLTTQADLSGLSEADRELHRAIHRRPALQAAGQGAVAVLGTGSGRGGAAAGTCGAPSSSSRPATASRSRSASAIPVPIPLRHRHPRRDGSTVEIWCAPPSAATPTGSLPIPSTRTNFVLELPCRTVEGKTFPCLGAFREAYSKAPVERLKVRIVR